MRVCTVCGEDCSLDMTTCPWCEGPLRAKRRGGKPAGKWGLMTDRQLRLAHQVHVRDGVSMRELGRQLYERFGYSSPKTCALALCKGWKRLGLPARDRIDATVRASTRHGLARRGKVDRSHKNALRRAREGVQAPCAGVKVNGLPCSRPSMRGSDYCIAHDPDRREANLAVLEYGRSVQRGTA